MGGVDALSTALDRLYAAFEAYERPHSFLACGCCWTGTRIAEGGWRDGGLPVVRVDAPGGARPLRSLPPDEVSVIATDVPLTGGDVNVLKHYFPRLCELAVRDLPDVYPDLAVVLSRLSDAVEVDGQPWWEWPPAEQAAVQEFLEVLWHDRRRAGPDCAAETLSALAAAAPHIGPYLSAWVEDDDPRAEGALRGVLADHDLLDSAICDSSWNRDYEPQRSNREALIAWLSSMSNR